MVVTDRRRSQRRERRLGELQRRHTLLFNGCSEQVASLYAGMELQKFFREVLLLDPLADTVGIAERRQLAE